MSFLRAVLLTDIVDSTAIASALGESRTREMWAAHDRLARSLEAEWHGVEIEKTDGMLLIFESTADAVGFANAYHAGLAAIDPPLKSRIGLHVAHVDIRQNSESDQKGGAAPSEVVGLAKPVVARVMATAMGGQTLMTAEARLSLGVTVWRVQSHGWWRLKGFAEAFELFEVGDVSSPFSPPPDTDKVYRVVQRGDLWQPLRAIEHNLPAERDRFEGRRDALRTLADKIQGGSRLISVLGTGGMGKTRLVTRFSWTWLGDFPGGAWFCDLSTATTIDGIHLAVAQALDVPLGTTDPSDQLAHAIANRGPCLVVLDNFEQVARYSEETIGRWLDRAVHATFIVTTREVLGIPGEDTLALGPLSSDDGAALFLLRSQLTRRASGAGEHDLEVIAELVRVLDGLPLAIELAAARIRIMSPRALLSRMNERFRLLGVASGRRDRQATLRATFNWSWELLTPFEKTALAQLSVFEGGFTHASAEAVVDFSTHDQPPWMLDVLQGLVDKSFVRHLQGDRFDLLESIRQYAAEHLATEGRFPGSSPEMAKATWRRHFTYFAAWADSWSEDKGIELNNLVVACRRACEMGDAKCAVGALTAAWARLQLGGPFQVAMGLVESIEATVELDEKQRAAIDWIAASAMDSLGQLAKSSERAKAGLERARSLKDRHLQGRFLCRVAEHVGVDDAKTALAHLDEARGLALETDDAGLRCLALAAEGNVFLHLGRPATSRIRYEEALQLATETGDERQQAGLLGNLGIVLFEEGDLDGANRTFDRCVATLRKLGDRRWEGNLHCNLGMLHIERKRPQEAAAELEQALSIARALGHARLECTVLCNLGIAAEESGDLARARDSYEAAVQLAAALGDRRSEGQFRGYLGLLLVHTGNVDLGLKCLDLGESLLLGASDEWNLALLLCRRARAHLLTGTIDSALDVLRRAQSIAANVSAGPASELGKAVEGLSRLLHARVPA